MEALGAAAWHLGLPAPEQSRQLLLAVNKVKALIKAAQCAAVISVPVGKHRTRGTAEPFRSDVIHWGCCFAECMHAVVSVGRLRKEWLGIVDTARSWQGHCSEVQVSWRHQH